MDTQGHLRIGALAIALGRAAEACSGAGPPFADVVGCLKMICNFSTERWASPLSLEHVLQHGPVEGRIGHQLREFAGLDLKLPEPADLRHAHACELLLQKWLPTQTILRQISSIAVRSLPVTGQRRSARQHIACASVPSRVQRAQKFACRPDQFPGSGPHRPTKSPMAVLNSGAASLAAGGRSKIDMDQSILCDTRYASSRIA